MSGTTKRVWTTDEWYPVIQLTGPEWGLGFEVDATDLPTDLVERYERAFAEFTSVHRELAEHLAGREPAAVFGMDVVS